MIEVHATVRCSTKGCANVTVVRMQRGYDDGVWNLPGVGAILGPHVIPGLEGWTGIG